MISGGDIGKVQGEYCGDVVREAPRLECERLVAKKFEGVCSLSANNDKARCESDVTVIFTGQYNSCGDVYEIIDDNKKKLPKIADCFHNNVADRAKGQEGKEFNVSQFNQQKLNGHLTIARKIYSPKPLKQNNRTFADAQRKFCANGLKQERKDCAKLIEDKSKEVCSVPDANECRQEIIAVFQAQHDHIAKNIKEKMPEGIDKAFSDDIQSPRWKFDVGDVKKLTSQEYLAILKQRYPITE